LSRYDFKHVFGAVAADKPAGVIHPLSSEYVLDIPTPLSPSSFWVRVRVSVRRCYRFSGLYAFRSSDSVHVAVGI
jgi:hypothetical protein